MPMFGRKEGALAGMRNGALAGTRNSPIYDNFWKEGRKWSTGWNEK